MVASLEARASMRMESALDRPRKGEGPPALSVSGTSVREANEIYLLPWVFYCRSESQKASTVQEENSTMQRITTLVRTLGVVTLVGMTSFAPPLPARAGGVHVSVGVGLP